MLRSFAEKLSKLRYVVVEDLPPSGLPYLLATEALPGPLLVVAADEERALQLTHDLRGLGLASVVYFPGDLHTPFEDGAADTETTFSRSAIRHQILTNTPVDVIVTSAAALTMRWVPQNVFQKHTALWVRGENVAREVMAQTLVQNGYQTVNLVEDEGTFAIRGSVVDIFVPGQERAIRLDLFGDEISSIKTFDPQTQRTFEDLEALAIFPLREIIFDPPSTERAIHRLNTLSESIDVATRRVRQMVDEISAHNYFYGIETFWPAFYETSEPVVDTLLRSASTVVLDDEEHVLSEIQTRYQKATAERQRLLDEPRLTLSLEEHLVAPTQVIEKLQEKPRLSVQKLAVHHDVPALSIRLRDWQTLAKEIDLRRKNPQLGEILDPFVAALKKLFEQRYHVFLTSPTRGGAERLRELLLARKIDLPLRPTLAFTTLNLTKSPQRFIAVGGPSQGLHDEEAKIAILTESEVFGAKKVEVKRKRRPNSAGLTTLKNLREGDVVIHLDHGLGRYLGLRRLVVGGADGDYLHLEYANGDKLYLPVYRIGLLQPFRGDNTHVKLDTLGGTRWEKAKQKVREAVLAIAHELLAVGAQRKSRPGFVCVSPDDRFRAFEANFPFEETPDQQQAIDAVLSDMTKNTPMDRLVCGDVGFGKTEVAIRAAFLAVQSKKQVAVLVPTTVLAEQHGLTFRERLSGEGVRVDVLSRFRSDQEAQDILQRLRDIKIDIIIGTHRLLSPDVAFASLGLLVVDEEQRFGVKHKERIKQLKANVHVLTLSATPIPRTLHMALTGLRDLSIIQTPPYERLSIKTEVVRFDEDVIAEAIRRELHRGGQVFVVHNRVQSIESIATLVRRLVPEARVAVAHGQMTPEKLEKIMVDFVRREVHILVSTAIVESGLDIPNANTMIVNRADTFGLSQLHQLRGRIGRGHDRAYAYLLLPRSDKITKDATERLAVLKRFSELGQGFQIATHDLDLRGSGDLLGADQSGHIAAVGLELYTELLNEAVEKAKGQSSKVDVEPDIKLPVVAVLPESYIPEPMVRLAFYQKMAEARSEDAIYDVASEIEERYGHAPDDVHMLAEVMIIRRRLKNLGANALSADVHDGVIKIGLHFLPHAAIDRQDIAQKIQTASERYRLLPSGRLAISNTCKKDLAPREFLQLVRHEVGQLKVQR